MEGARILRDESLNHFLCEFWCQYREEVLNILLKKIKLS